MTQGLIDYGQGIGIYIKGNYIYGLLGIIIAACVASILLLAFHYRHLRQKDKGVATNSIKDKQLLKIAKGVCQRFSKQTIESQKTPLLVKHSTLLSESYSIHTEHNLTAISNFCIYMGEWTNKQQSILTQFELIVIDPKAIGIETLKRSDFTGKYIIAAVNVDSYYQPAKNTFDKSVMKDAVESFCSDIITDIFSILQNTSSGSPLFDGIYLDSFDSLSTLTLLSPIAEVFQSMGILVFISLKSPTFNADTLPDTTFFNGLFLQNVTLNPDGSRKDYFDLIPHFHNIVKTYTDQVVYRKDFVCFMEERVSDKGYLELTPTLVNRFMRISQYYKFVPWMTSVSGVYDSNILKSITRPTNALEFMGRLNYQSLKNQWVKHKVNVQQDTSKNLDWNSINPFFTHLDALFPTNLVKIEKVDYEYTQIDNHSGFDYEVGTGTGQYTYGAIPSQKYCDAIVDGQRVLMDRNLSQKVDQSTLRTIVEQLHTIVEDTSSYYASIEEETKIKSHIKELINWILNDRISVYQSLDSGYWFNDIHYWSVGECVGQKSTTANLDCDSITIYVSLKHPSLIEGILGTYLSLNGVSQQQMFYAEMALNGGELPRHVQEQLNTSTPFELLTLVHLTENKDLLFERKVRDVCEEKLVQDVDIEQILHLASNDLITGKMSIQEFLDKKLKWYCPEYLTITCPDYSIDKLSLLFGEVNAFVGKYMLNPIFPDPLQTVQDFLSNAYATAPNGIVDSRIEMLATFFLSSFKIYGFDEVYSIVSDHNPLPSREPDQQGVMAELNILGSRCTEFFDIPIQTLSDMLYTKRREYLTLHPPPIDAYSDQKFMLTYLPLVQCGADNTKKKQKLEFKALSAGLIFAVPAVLDLVLLLITGNGTFVNVRMTRTEQTFISIALLVTLLCSAILSPLIASSGSYYLYLFQFPSMATILIQQLSASLVLIWSMSTIAAIVIGAMGSTYGAIIFLFYMFVFSTYFLLLSCMATMYTDGISIPSGKNAVWLILPLAVIYWPISYFLNLGQDNLVTHAAFWSVYIVVWVYVFKVYLGIFTGWINDVVQTSETETLAWFANKHQFPESALLPNKRENFKKEIARQQLDKEVMAEYSRTFAVGGSSDKYVKKLAKGYGATRYLLVWHSLNQGYTMPPLFGVEWNLNVKLALDDMNKLNKASKINRSRLMYHWSKKEAGFGLGYILLLLLDRWIVLFSGDSLLGLLTINNPEYGIASGAAIMYFLIAATILDFISVNIWKAINNLPDKPFFDSKSLVTSLEERKGTQKYFYYYYLRILAAYCFLIWAAMALFMWIYTTRDEAVWVFSLLTFAYTGLLWAIYCKLFTPENSSAATRSCLFAAFFGFLIGIPLHKFYPNHYTEQAVFVFCAWLAAVLSWRGVLWNYQSLESLIDKPNLVTGQHMISESVKLSNDQIERHLNQYISSESVVVDLDDVNGKAIIDSMNSSISLNVEGGHLRMKIKSLLSSKAIVMNLVPEGRLAVNGEGYSALPYREEKDASLEIFIGVSFHCKEDISRCFAQNKIEHIKVIEAVVHEVLEVLCNYTHHEAVYGEMYFINRSSKLNIPARLLNDISCRPTNKIQKIINNTRSQVVKHLLLNEETDKLWMHKSSSERLYAIQRVGGRFKSQDFISNTTENMISSSKAQVAATLSILAITCCIFSRSVIGKSHSNLSQLKGESNAKNLPFNFYDSLKHASIKRKIIPFFDAIGRLFYCMISGDPYLSRELDAITYGYNKYIRKCIITPPLLLNVIYRNIYVAILENIAWSNNPVLHLLKQSSSRAIYKNVSRLSIQIMNPLNLETAFVISEHPYILQHYNGLLVKEPQENHLVTKISEYVFNSQQQLESQLIMKKGEVVYQSQYQYESHSSKFPFSKETLDVATGLYDVYYYDVALGFVIKSQIYKRDIQFSASYSYAVPIETQEVSEIMYKSEDLEIKTFFVSISEQSKLQTPCTKIQKVEYTTTNGSFIATWNYDHKRHPIMKTTNSLGEIIPNARFLIDDEYGILDRPSGLFFAQENLALGVESNFIGMKNMGLKFNTRNSRTALWKLWLNTNTVDGVWARLIDEILLRKEPLLKPYWRRRDFGDIHGACEYLEANEDNIVAAIGVGDEVSANVHFSIRMADLYVCGIGGDTYINQLKPTEQAIPDLGNDIVQVFGLQTGTWPNANGGVSNCVRDLVNNIKTCRWTVFSETGNDMEIIVKSFQIEENVNSVCLLPLWGYDFLDPINTLTSTRLDYEIELKRSRRSEEAEDQLIEILTRYVALAHIRNLTMDNLDSIYQVFSDYYDFFQVHDYSLWQSNKVTFAWMNILTSHLESDSGEIEYPTVLALRSVMEFTKRSMFCFTVTLPNTSPDVIQATHHAIGSVYGVLMKKRLGCALQVWDHGVLWREYLSQWSGSQSRFRPFVFNTMIRFARMAASLTLFHTDTILPCTNIANPLWETERATSHGNTCHRLKISRRIDPIINGISNMESYTPDFSMTLPDPTIIMLSHIVPVKDIKNALLSWDIIINQFKLTKLFLNIYGSTDKVPWYTVECETLLTTLNLKNNVKLKGFGDSKTVLKSAWAVLNSSMTEGLPLALGEAGLSGAPIVCTEAGGSREVIKNEKGYVYGKTVNTNSPYELALGQISVLGLFDGLEDIAEGRDPSPDAIKLIDYISAGRTEEIHQRILDMKEKRQLLGMRLRDLVKAKFSGDRYLREHEQMLWIGKYQTKSKEEVNDYKKDFDRVVLELDHYLL